MTMVQVPAASLIKLGLTPTPMQFSWGRLFINLIKYLSVFAQTTVDCLGCY